MGKRKSIPAPVEVPEQIVVTDTLDLHGFFPEQIPEMIEAFIENAQHLRLAKLRIIHGKGKSRLKHTVHRALMTNPQVHVFYDAPPHSGGWGTTIVELAPNHKNKPTRHSSQKTPRLKNS
jgi:DNA-nicking Smr family endonuclease